MPPLIDVTKKVEPESGVHKILKEAGILKKGQKTDLASALEDSGLGLSETLNRVRQIAEGGDSDSVRINANKMVLEMHGALKQDTGRNIPAVNITIVDSASVSINPILMPRK